MKQTADRQEILRLLKEEGLTQAEVAERLGISRMTVVRAVKEARLAAMPLEQRYPVPPNLSPRALPVEPRSRLAAIRDGWLSIAERTQEKLLKLARAGKANTPLNIQAGVASQRAAELVNLLDEGFGLPEQLPENDEDARRLVMQLWWQTARHGSSNATRQLAHALGVRSAAQQPVDIGFERPDCEEEEADASSAPAVPAAGTRLN